MVKLDPMPSPERQSPANPVGAQDTKKPKAIAEESDKVTDFEDDTKTSTTKDDVGNIAKTTKDIEGKYTEGADVSGTDFKASALAAGGGTPSLGAAGQAADKAKAVAASSAAELLFLS